MIKNSFFYDLNYKQDEVNELFQKIKSEYTAKEVGYYHLLDSKEVINQINTYANTTTWVKTIVVVGIGGSSLGTKAIHELLCTSHDSDKNIRFLESVGPNAVKQVLGDIDFNETLFLIISKSGTTIETISNFKYVLEKFNVNLEEEQFKKHFVYITDVDSKLDKFAKSRDLKVFYIPLNVGGRFSVLSSVGLLPLALLGYNIEELLSGAKLLRERFFSLRYDNLIKKALFLANNSIHRPVNALFSYSSTFRYFNDWYVQLWGESLGKIDKNGKRVGLTPVGLVGSIDQHSFLQLLTEGPIDKSLTFIKVDDFQNDIKIPKISIEFLEDCDYINGYSFNHLINAQCDATMQSVIQSGISVDLIEVDDFSEKNIGFLIFYYELLTSLTALAMDINAYDQPGVEIGKKILKEKFDN